MIKLSNGHGLNYVVPSGTLGFKGRGWFWERPLVALGFMDLSLFSIGVRTLTRRPRLYPVSNLSWIRPWTWLPWSSHSCVRLLPNGGAINKVGLYNPGIDWWVRKVGPKLSPEEMGRLVLSIWGNKEELVDMTRILNQFPFRALEINDSCPNTGHALEQARTVIEDATAVREVSVHPIIIKVSVDQDYLAIARGLSGIAEAISLNSVPWKIIFPELRSPLESVGSAGSGGGGVSGKTARLENWTAVRELAQQGSLPVIAPGIMEYGDMDLVRAIGASAVSFGSIHLPTWGKPWTIFTNPCKATQFVKKELSHQ